MQIMDISSVLSEWIEMRLLTQNETLVLLNFSEVLDFTWLYIQNIDCHAHFCSQTVLSCCLGI